MNKSDLEFFKQNGYISLGKVLTGEEVVRYASQYDRDRDTVKYLWGGFGHHQTLNCDSLVSWPEVDELIRHPKILPAVGALIGEPVCFSEVCVRHMASYEGELHQSWHRDRAHDKTHPLRMPYLQVMLYLSDVDEQSHCFSISPESIDEPILDDKEQLERAGSVDLHGPAGTALLFNIAVLHTATVRPTDRERKSVQTYYGRISGEYLSNDSCIPTRLWREHQDQSVRKFYGNLNPKSRLYADAFGTGRR